MKTVDTMGRPVRYKATSRFWSHVEVTDTCWLWRSTVGTTGYGQFCMFGKYRKAHRVAYTLSVGEIPEGMFVLHRCDVPLCVNPDHLFLGTHQDNMADKAKKKRAGKKLTPEQASEIRARVAAGEQQRSVAAAFGISQAAVSKIARGEWWS